MKLSHVVLSIPLLLVALMGFGALTPAAAARPPLVLAFYYAWFDENSWTPNHVADMPVTPYSSRDLQAMARQIRQAQGAGIDAFVVSWWGPGNPTDANLKSLLDQAREANFRIAVDFEVTSPFYASLEDTVQALKTLLTTHAQHPAYLRVDGKPVVFFWREQKYAVSTWHEVRNGLDPARQSLWIAEGVREQLPYLRVFDGFHLYSIAWASNVTAELAKWPERVRAYGADKIWIATVMPGNDDTRTGRRNAYVRERRGGEFYRETWRAAFASSPDWTIITSWNEWVEGTAIEPSVTYGNLYLDITRDFSASFKAGLPAPISKPTSTSAPTPTLIPGGVRATVTDTLRVRAEPNTQATILGRLREGTVITILARTNDSGWWQIAYPDVKRRGWVSAEYTAPAGETSMLPVVEGMDTPTPTPESTPEQAASKAEPTVFPTLSIPPSLENPMLLWNAYPWRK